MNNDFGILRTEKYLEFIFAICQHEICLMRLNAKLNFLAMGDFDLRGLRCSITEHEGMQYYIGICD